jgi:hypothetical protein
MARALPLLAVAVVALVLTGPVQATPPIQDGPFEFDLHVDDFFGPGPPTCHFVVVGDWHVVARQTTFTGGQGNVTMIYTHIDFAGTLSNPENDKSIPDSGLILLWDYFAPDGSFVSEAEHHTRFNPLLRAAFRTVTDSSGAIVFDVGRDWIPFNRHPISIEPVCAALS